MIRIALCKRHIRHLREERGIAEGAVAHLYSLAVVAAADKRTRPSSRVGNRDRRRRSDVLIDYFRLSRLVEADKSVGLNLVAVRIRSYAQHKEVPGFLDIGGMSGNVVLSHIGIGSLEVLHTGACAVLSAVYHKLDSSDAGRHIGARIQAVFGRTRIEVDIDIGARVNIAHCEGQRQYTRDNS